MHSIKKLDFFRKKVKTDQFKINYHVHTTIENVESVLKRLITLLY